MTDKWIRYLMEHDEAWKKYDSSKTMERLSAKLPGDRNLRFELTSKCYHPDKIWQNYTFLREAERWCEDDTMD